MTYFLISLLWGCVLMSYHDWTVFVNTESESIEHTIDNYNDRLLLYIAKSSCNCSAIWQPYMEESILTELAEKHKRNHLVI